MLCDDIRFLTQRALWETKNLIHAFRIVFGLNVMMTFPCGNTFTTTLYSMDRWFINPCDTTYQDPPFHMPGLMT